MCDAASRGRQRVGQVHWFFDTPTSGKHPSSVPQEGTEVGGEAVRVLELKAVAGVRIQCEPAFGNRMGEHDRIDCWEGGVAVTICHQSWSLNGLDLLVPVSLIPEEGREIGRASCRERVCQYV